MDFKHTSIKQSALGWVKKSIDENLSTIRSELNVYIEEKDASILDLVQEKLRAIQGVLSMIEQYGAAMLAEEMRSLCQFISAKEHQQDQQALEVLLRAVLQLPDYLEHIQGGQKDIPIAILPLMNDIRAAKNEDLFSEKLLFLPDLSMHGDDEFDAISENKNQHTRQLAKKLRPSYQYSILGLIQDKDVDTNLSRISKITEIMEERSSSEQVARLWWIVGALIESVSRDNLPLGVSVKMLMGKVDQIFRNMILKGEKELIRVQPIELIKNLLYYIAQPECDGPKSQAIKTAYRLEQFLPSSDDQANAIAGPNNELLKTVSEAVKADIEEVKSTLEVYVNGDIKNTELLANIPQELHVISDTLAMIGLGPQRQLVEAQIAMIASVVDGEEAPDSEKLLGMAAELIQIDHALELMQKGHLHNEGGGVTSSDTSRNFEMDNMLSGVVTAALDDIQKIKGAILDFIKDTTKIENIQFCNTLLRETRGALDLLNEKRSVTIIDGLIHYLDNHEVAEFMDSDRLDQLSQVVVSIEYYLEAVGEQRLDADSILDFADTQLQLLLEGKASLDFDLSGSSDEQVNLLIVDSGVDETSDESLVEEQPQDEPSSDEDHEDVASDIVTDLQEIQEVVDTESTEVPEEIDIDLTAASSVDDQSEPDKAELSNAADQEDSLAAASDQVQVIPVEDDLVVLKPGSDPEILEIYLEEAEEESENIKQFQKDWKLHPEDGNALKNIRRSFHTIKGSGRLVGAMKIGEFAWDFESLLNRVIDKALEPSEQIIDAVGMAAEVLPELVEELKNGTAVKGDIAYLRGLVKNLSEFKADQVLASRKVDSEKKEADKDADSAEEIEPDADSIAISAEELQTEINAEPESGLDSEASHAEAEMDAELEQEDPEAELRVESVEAELRVDSIVADLAEDFTEDPDSELIIDLPDDDLTSEAGEELQAGIIEPELDIDLEQEDPEAELRVESVEAELRVDSIVADLAEDFTEDSDSELIIDLPDNDLTSEAGEELEAKIIIEPELDVDLEQEDPEAELRVESVEAELRVNSIADDLAENFEEDADSELVIDQQEDVLTSEVDEELQAEIIIEPELDADPEQEDPEAELRVESVEAELRVDSIVADLAEDFTEDSDSELIIDLPDDDLTSEAGEELQAEIIIEPELDVDLEQEDDSEAELRVESVEAELRVNSIASDLAEDFEEDTDSELVIDQPENVLTSEAGAGEELQAEIIIEPELDADLEQDDDPEAELRVESVEAELRVDSVEADLEDVFEEPVQAEPELEPLPSNIDETSVNPPQSLNQQEETPPDPFVLNEMVNMPGGEVEQPLPEELEKNQEEPSETTDLQIDPELLVIYQQEVESHLNTVNSVLEEPSEDGGFKPTEALYRAIHTINGASRTADIASIGQLATLLEKPLKIILEQGSGLDEESLELFKRGHDAIKEMTTSLVKNRKIPELPEDLSQDLQQLLEQMDNHTVELPSQDDEPVNQFIDTLSMMNESEDTDYDDELVEIFIEEATELLDMSDHTLQSWSQQDESIDDSANFGLVMELQRYLHTLKGGAKMADFNEISDLSHELESLFIAVIDSRIEKSDDLIDVLHDSFDLLSNQVIQAKNHKPISSSQNQIAVIKQLRAGGKIEDVIQKPTEDSVDQSDSGDIKSVSDVEEKTASSEIGMPEHDRRQQEREVVKVRSDLLDNLVNSAGEVSIYRARMEQQVSSFGVNLSELGSTITRLKNQLRALEAETDAQIHFSHKEEADGRQNFDPLEMDRYTQIQELSKSLGESVDDLSSLQNILGDQVKDSETLLLQQSRINTDLQDGLIRSRMVRFSGLTSRLRRLVRKTSSELAKKVELEIEGEHHEVDIKVLDRMVAPLEHIIRNAISHGIESPADRISNGKAATGKILIKVSRDGSDVVLQISDDGAGVNVRKVRARALELGLLGEHEDMDDADLVQFILEPGFSTAEQVTQVAGRGVGMDVVDSGIKQLGGSLQIATSTSGTVFTARLPFTLSINQAILVQAGDESFALPLINIEGITRIESDHMADIYKTDKPVLDYAGHQYSLYYLTSLLDSSKKYEVVDDALKVPIILLRSGDLRIALHIDVLLGNREIVVKPLGKLLSQVKGISGASILADGRVVLILEINGLIRHGITTTVIDDEADVQTREEVHQPAPSKKVVMVVDDSITMRRVATKLLTRNNYEVVTAKDGVDALAQLQDVDPDVMLLDIEMPRMDGFELALHMKNEANFRDIPIIMITSRTGSKHRDHAMKIGVNKYMGKPYQEEELIENISALLG